MRLCQSCRLPRNDLVFMKHRPEGPDCVCCTRCMKANVERHLRDLRNGTVASVPCCCDKVLTGKDLFKLDMATYNFDGSIGDNGEKVHRAMQEGSARRDARVRDDAFGVFQCSGCNDWVMLGSAVEKGLVQTCVCGAMTCIGCHSGVRDDKYRVAHDNSDLCKQKWNCGWK